MPTGVEVAHRVGGGADARDDEGVGVSDGARVGGHVRYVAGVGDGAGDGAQVACAVVNNDDLEGDGGGHGGVILAQGRRTRDRGLGTGVVGCLIVFVLVLPDRRAAGAAVMQA